MVAMETTWTHTHIDLVRRQKSSRFPLIKFYGKKQKRKRKDVGKDVKYKNES